MHILHWKCAQHMYTHSIHKLTFCEGTLKLHLIAAVAKTKITTTIFSSKWLIKQMFNF
jgi:hypothetical protein